MPKFKVKGVAYITVEVEMTVTATTNVEALGFAKAEFSESKRKGDFVVPNSSDESHPFECKFHTAEPLS